MIKFRKSAEQGEMIPRFYGIAWVDYEHKCRKVCYPIPFNFIMGWGLALLIVLKCGPEKIVRKIKLHFS